MGAHLVMGAVQGPGAMVPQVHGRCQLSLLLPPAVATYGPP